MKSDPHFYKIFQTCPELFLVFAPIDLSAGYRFGSQAYKAIDRTYDGIFEAEDDRAPTYIVEYQVKNIENIYPRVFLEMAGYQLEHPKREVRGLLIFLNRKSDPQPVTWWAFSQGCGMGFQVVYLDQVLAELTAEHPLVATLKPLIESNRTLLEQQVSTCLRNIRGANLDLRQKDTLEDVFLSLLTQRFQTMTKKEVVTMFGLDTPVEETVFYKEVFHEGEVKGIVKGEAKGIVKGEAKGEAEGAIKRITDEINSLRGFYEQGYLPKPVYEQRLRELEQARAQNNAKIAELNR